MSKTKKVTRKVTRKTKFITRKRVIKKHTPSKSNRIKVSVKIPVVNISPILESASSQPVKKTRRRRCKNGSSKMYFTDDTEQAIILFNNTEDQDIREQIFKDRIHRAFSKLVENVFNTFKFSYFETGPLDVQKECLTHLVANIHKFDPNRTSKLDPTKKSKAFAYFSIIAKHYFILLNNTNYKKFNQNVEISEERDENTIQLQQHDKYYAQQEMSDFIRLIIEFWETNVDKIFTKQRDLDIANAVVELIRSSHNISMFNKKALYLYIREISDCHTQQITKVINKMKVFHNKMKWSYQNEGIVDTERYNAIE